MLPTTPTSRSITHAEASHFLWFQSATFMDPFLPSRNRGRRPSHKCLSPFPSSLARNVFRQGVVPLLPMMYRDSHACRSFASLYSHSVSGGWVGTLGSCLLTHFLGIHWPQITWWLSMCTSPPTYWHSLISPSAAPLPWGPPLQSQSVLMAADKW